MNISEELKLLSISNLSHGIGVFLLLNSITDFTNIEWINKETRSISFLLIFTLLFFDWCVNLYFLFSVYMKANVSNIYGISSVSFLIVSLISRIEVTRFTLYGRTFFFDTSLFFILPFSSFFFGLILIEITKNKDLIINHEIKVKTIGISHFILSLLLIIILILEQFFVVREIAGTIYFLNFIKYLTFPFLSAYVFFSWSRADKFSNN